MSVWGARHQALYIGGACIFFAVLVFAWYVFFGQQKPTCFDGVQNQGELSVDCGGGCAAVCHNEVTDIITHWSRVFRVRDGAYDAVALIENPNPFGVRSVPYIFKVYDTDNLLVREISGSTYLNPNERALVLAGDIDVGRRVPARVFIELPERPFWERFGDIERPKLSVSNKHFFADPYPRMEATITNESFFPVGEVVVSAVVVNEEGNAIAASQTLIDGLAPSKTANVFFTWPEPFAMRAAFIDIIPRVNSVDRE